MSSRSLDTRIFIAREPCDLCGHDYHPTWETGHVVCLRCGKRAACSVCVSQWPDTKLAFHLCPTHRPKEEAV